MTAPKDTSRLMQAMDQLNRQYGRGTVTLGSAGLQTATPAWQMKQERLSPRFTTCWEEMAWVRGG